MKEGKDEIWEETRKSLEKLSEKVVSLAKKGKEEGLIAYRVGKIRLEIIGLRHKIDDKFREMGRKINELYKKDKIENTELQCLCKEVDVIEDIIRSKEKEIEVISGRKK